MTATITASRLAKIKILRLGTGNNFYVFSPDEGGLFLDKYDLQWKKEINLKTLFPSWADAYGVIKNSLVVK